MISIRGFHDALHIPRLHVGRAMGKRWGLKRLSLCRCVYCVESGMQHRALTSRGVVGALTGVPILSVVHVCWPQRHWKVHHVGPQVLRNAALTPASVCHLVWVGYPAR